MLEKNCHQLSGNALEKLLIYSASSQAGDNAEIKAINDKFDQLMNSTSLNQGVFSFYTNESMDLLQLNNNDLINRVDQSLINALVDDGHYKGASVAFLLAGTPEGRAILQADNYRLAGLIDENSLNHVVEQYTGNEESISSK